MKQLVWGSVSILVLVGYSLVLTAQVDPAPTLVQAPHLKALQWREIGPFRGGRVNAVAGRPDQPLVYYFGSTGGGLWKTENAGLSWYNISDGYFQTGSIGAIALAPSDPNIIYVGTGEHAVRGVASSHGDGVYRSDDGGASWRHIGLSGSRQIAAILVHPQQADWLYVAVQGAAYGPSEDRGIYRSTDGGKHWERILFINSTTGVSDLSMDPSNPRILYAGSWDHQRQPWHIRSGGPGSGLWKSTDGGENWTRLSNGLPAAMGKTAIAVSPADPERLYANLEAERGGVYRSDDGGRSWQQVSASRSTIARAWYFTEIVPDPRDPETVYVLNDPLLRSTDGGKTFTEIPTPHVDQHALWINPLHPEQLIVGNDGGAAVSVDGGCSWSSQMNQPTGQFYRVTTDDSFPYYIYGAQQDQTTVAIPSRTLNSSGIGLQDWFSVGGNESGFIAFDPQAPTTIFSGGYQGNITRYDRKTGRLRDIMHYPSLGLATQPADMRYRFNWNAPLITDPVDHRTIYHGAQFVLRSRDQGNSWVAISPDLTRNDRDRQGPGGGPFTNEGAGAETYNTISYIAASPLRENLLWVGTDDGRLHLSRDGQTWTEVTPPGLEEGNINSIEASPHQAGAAYVVVQRFKFNDYSPLIYHTADYGKTWTKIVRGINFEDFVRVVREDRLRPGLLYAGTETGFYISTNNGQYWQRLQLNLPVVPINDIRHVYNAYANDIVVATSGRGFWVLDELAPLQQGADLAASRRPALFQPSPAPRLSHPPVAAAGIGQNPQPGVAIDYFIPAEIDSLGIQLEILNDKGDLIRRYSRQATDSAQSNDTATLPAQRGLNRFYWDLRRPTPPQLAGSFVLGNYQGGLVSPGIYTLRLTLANQVLEKQVEVLPDPGVEADPEAYAKQEAFLLAIENMLREIHATVSQLRGLREQFAFVRRQMTGMISQRPEKLIMQADTVLAHIDALESRLCQTEQYNVQDAVNFPHRLNAELMDLHGRADSFDPHLTYGMQTRLADLQVEWKQYRQERDKLLRLEVVAFNRSYLEQQLPPIHIPPSGLEEDVANERMGHGYGGKR